MSIRFLVMNIKRGRKTYEQIDVKERGLIVSSADRGLIVGSADRGLIVGSADRVQLQAASADRTDHLFNRLFP